MSTPLLIRVDPQQPDAESLRPAADALRHARLVAFPTETVYGLGAFALRAEAVAKIFEAKGRPATNPLIVHVASIARARELVRSWQPRAQALAEAFWPGPLTLVLPKAHAVPDIVTASLDSVALRMPAHPVARALLELADVPVAAPSANRYTELSPTRADHVLEGLGSAVDVLVDGGPTQVGIESTVLSLLGSRPRILRLGMTTASAIAEVLATEVEGPTSRPADEDQPARSPGQAARHYAPRARLRLIEDLAEASPEAGLITWIPAPPGRDSARTIELPDHAAGYAASLYEAMHRLDAMGCPTIDLLRPPQAPGWEAIHDRLARAIS